MKKLLLVSVLSTLGMLLVASQPSQALERADAMQVSVWPEYDDPRLLIQFMGSVPEDVTLPTQVEGLVPKGVDMGMTCSVAPDGRHYMSLWDSQSAGDKYDLVTWEASERHFHLEYYHDVIEMEDGEKVINVAYKAPFAIDRLSIVVQKPKAAKNFSFESSRSYTAQDGLIYFEQEYSDVEAGTEIPIVVSYVNPQGTLSAPAGAGGGGGGTSPGGEPAAGSNFTLGVAALIIGIFLAALIYYFVGKSPQRAPSPAPRGAGAPRSRSTARPGGSSHSRRTKGKGLPKPASHTRDSAEDTSGAPRSPKFCSQCGGELDPGDRFCPQCGASVKRRS